MEGNAGAMRSSVVRFTQREPEVLEAVDQRQCPKTSSIRARSIDLQSILSHRRSVVDSCGTTFENEPVSQTADVVHELEAASEVGQLQLCRASVRSSSWHVRSQSQPKMKIEVAAAIAAVLPEAPRSSSPHAPEDLWKNWGCRNDLIDEHWRTIQSWKTLRSSSRSCRNRKHRGDDRGHSWKTMRSSSRPFSTPCSRPFRNWKYGFDDRGDGFNALARKASQQRSVWKDANHDSGDASAAGPILVDD
jgi:hypothetical protein